jgi:hypothetical protein
MVRHEVDLLVERQAPEQVGDALIVAQLWITERQVRLRLHQPGRQQQCSYPRQICAQSKTHRQPPRKNSED